MPPLDGVLQVVTLDGGSPSDLAGYFAADNGLTFTVSSVVSSSEPGVGQSYNAQCVFTSGDWVGTAQLGLAGSAVSGIGLAAGDNLRYSHVSGVGPSPVGGAEVRNLDVGRDGSGMLVFASLSGAHTTAVEGTSVYPSNLLPEIAVARTSALPCVLPGVLQDSPVSQVSPALSVTLAGSTAILTTNQAAAIGDYTVALLSASSPVLADCAATSDDVVFSIVVARSALLRPLTP